MNVHHVGIAVRDIHAAKKKYELLGYRMEQDMIWDEKRNIRIVFMENGGNRIELIEAADPEQSCAVTGFLAGTKKNVMYHICFETQDIGCEIERLLNARGGEYFWKNRIQRRPVVTGGWHFYILRRRVL